MDVSKISTSTWTIVFLITNLSLSYLLFNVINLEPSLSSVSLLTIITPLLVFTFVKIFLATPSPPTNTIITIPPPPPPSTSIPSTSIHSTSTPSTSAPSNSSKQKSN
ncbi:hypothetical protein C1645_757676 [Glomus cerebriforme]|uniref:Uncharacterized protein n=1 Tax=Glomus cerebriforme TaxID=658196 RepID=A0A397TAW5_9GLOM|nr:hypothetical protein C1645_757676 [Glomus cerebriforme]